MDHRADSYRHARPEALPTDPPKNSAYYSNSYEPLSQHNARQVPFDVAKTWDNNKGAAGRGGLRHSQEASPSAGMLSVLESHET